MVSTRGSRETFRQRGPAEGNRVGVEGPPALAKAVVLPEEVPDFRNEDKTGRDPVTRRCIVYRRSPISSTPRFTKGAAANPTKIPESERRTAVSIRKRATPNSRSISRREILSHRTLARMPSHSEAVKGKKMDAQRMQ